MFPLRFHPTLAKDHLDVSIMLMDEDDGFHVALLVVVGTKAIPVACEDNGDSSSLEQRRPLPQQAYGATSSRTTTIEPRRTLDMKLLSLLLGNNTAVDGLRD